MLFALGILLRLALQLPPASTPPLPADMIGPDAVQRAFESMVRDVAPSVVSLRVRRRVLLPDTAADRAEQHLIVNGTGMVIDADGLILTNEHVVQAAAGIDVTLSDGEQLEGRLVASDARSDLAVVRIDRHALSPVRFCRADHVRRGQWAVALGNPYGIGGDGQSCFSVGVIANLGRRLPGLGDDDDRFYGDMIQTSAAINPGNSGGPLFNIGGEVIGVITAMHVRSGQSDGVGFALPINERRRRLIERLARGEAIEYGFVGMSVRTADARERRAAGVESDAGVVVSDVEPGGPAAAGGVQVGDVVTELDGQPITSTAELVETIGTAEIGRAATLAVRRAGRMVLLDVQIARRDAIEVAWIRGGAILWRGLRLIDRSRPDTATPTVPQAGVVVVDVAPNSPGARAGFAIGDIIERIGDQRLTAVATLRRMSETLADTVEVRLANGTRRSIGVR
ncbi:MAG: hypothetical protein CHACPFDD_00364 [Phycisphaerae bacterium]|nr:hypothetical protein [Phycisphaerae bacterium]